MNRVPGNTGTLFLNLYAAMTKQYEYRLPPFKRGFHLITHLIENQLRELPTHGLVNIFIKHTSAGLTINENADPTVRQDLDGYFDRAVPENQSWYRHTMEGADDMPAHIKAALVGNSITIPVTNGRLNLGTWQGIYLCEFRNHASGRQLVVTVLG
jgi:secondary thiamine-phosphate synthase enzyme